MDAAPASPAAEEAAARRSRARTPTDRFDGAPTEIPSGSPRAARKPAAASPAAEEAPAPKKSAGGPRSRPRRRGGRRAQEGRGPPVAAGRAQARRGDAAVAAQAQDGRAGVAAAVGRAERLAQVQPGEPEEEGLQELAPLRVLQKGDDRRRVLPPAGHARRPEVRHLEGLLQGPARARALVRQQIERALLAFFPKPLCQ